MFFPFSFSLPPLFAFKNPRYPSRLLTFTELLNHPALLRGPNRKETRRSTTVHLLGGRRRISSPRSSPPLASTFLLLVDTTCAITLNPSSSIPQNEYPSKAKEDTNKRCHRSPLHLLSSHPRDRRGLFAPPLGWGFHRCGRASSQSHEIWMTQAGEERTFTSILHRILQSHQIDHLTSPA